MRRTKVGAALAAAALALMGMLPAASPAQAAPAGKDCYLIQGQIICVPLAVNWHWWEDCPMCGLYHEHDEDPVINPEIGVLVNKYLTQGLGELSQAAVTTDPARKAALRGSALETFTSAARAANGSRLLVRRVGRIDPATGRIEPIPDPWLAESAIDLADGVALLQRSFADPAAAPRYRALAVAQFDEAYAEVADRRVIAG